MATSYGEIKITTGFADDTARDIKLGPFAPTAEAITNAKANIKAFDAETVKNLYLSDGGATCTGINAATITVTEENELNLNAVD